MLQDTEPLSVGVVGVGAMGRHHARVYTELPTASLCGISDVDERQAMQVAEEYGCRSYPLEELLTVVDAVSIAVPTKHHFAVAKQCLEAGVHVLIEKPFVATPAEGRELIRLAEAASVTLQVGHIERFNPAVLALADIVSDLDVISVRADRLGPPPEREVGEDAILDLMIHDIDIVLSLFEGDPRIVSCIGARENTFATATLQFPSSVIATLTASRVTQMKSRSLEITTDECFIDVDYIANSLELHKHAFPTFNARGSGVGQRIESVVERPMLSGEEPLRAELRAFIDAVRDGTTPKVTGEDGLRALELSLEIEELTRAPAYLPEVTISKNGGA
jgi:predicted dehydrogenase